MNYYCECCDKNKKPKSKHNHLKTFTHIQYENCFRINHTIKNPDFFDIDKTSKEYITAHNKKFVFFLVKCDLKLVVKKSNSHNKTGFCRIATIFKWKRYTLCWIEYFFKRM